jgi:quinol-cytochrome oxidoreductase complex cytochrome b subunit
MILVLHIARVFRGPRWARLVLALALAGVLTAAFLPVGVAPVIGGSDWISHGTAFAVLAVLMVVAFPRLALVWGWMILAGVGVGIEIVQAIPLLGRGPSIVEAAYDAAVVALVFVVLQLSGLRRVLQGGRRSSTR